MKVDIVKQPRTLTVITFVAVSALIFARLACAPYPVESAVNENVPPLGGYINGLFGRQTIMLHVVSLALFLINVALMIQLIVKYNIGSARSYLPIIMYLIIGYGSVAPLGNVSAVFVSTLLIVSSGQMIASFKRSYTFGNVFNSAFCMGLMPLIYSASLPLMFILPISLSLYRRTAREWIVASAGLCMPLLFASVGCYIAGDGWGLIVNSLISGFTASVGEGIGGVSDQIGAAAYVYGGVMIVILLLSLAAIIADFYKISVRLRKIYAHFLCLTLLSITTFFVPSGSIVSFGLVAIPASLISSAFFIRFRGVFSMTIYIVSIVLVVVMNAIPLFRVLS